MIAISTGGSWHFESRYGTTAASYDFANQPPAIYRYADDPSPIINPLSVSGWLEQQILAPLPQNKPAHFAPSKAYADEMLNWDAALKVEPARPSGTFVAKFKDEGRDKPSPTRDPWD